MTEPILDGACIVPLVRQCVAAGVAEHVAVDREGQSGALTNALDLPIDCIRREAGPSLGLEYEWGLCAALQLPQRP